ncbi:MAG: ABC transporter ATP-binding protein [Angustibacter sp.]
MTARVSGPADEVLGADGLTKSYGRELVLEELTLSVGAGEVVALVGANGSGKSTLLECLAGAVPFERGSIRVLGRRSDPSSTAHWRAVYGVLDDFTWLPDLSVADHLMLMSPNGDTGLVREALQRFGVAAFGGRDPVSLSAGQRQRAALATILVRPWRVLLLDEPERHLDQGGIETLAGELTPMASESIEQRCIVLSSHSSELVARLGCRVVEMGRATGSGVGAQERA